MAEVSEKQKLQSTPDSGLVRDGAAGSPERAGFARSGVDKTSSRKAAPGLTFRRFFTKAEVSPYDVLTWERRIAQITDAQGKVIFEQKDVEVPKDWSMTATNIVASKYLHGQLGTPERETGVRQLVGRVAETITGWGRQGGYFHSPEDAPDLPRRTGSPAAQPDGGLQLARVVQRRLRPHRAQGRRRQLALEPRRPRP